MTPEPMSIYHPDAAKPRKAAQRRRVVRPVMSEEAYAAAMMREAIGRAGHQDEPAAPSKRRPATADTMAHKVRLFLAQGPATFTVLAARMDLPLPVASSALSEQVRYGMATRDPKTKACTITAKGIAAIQQALSERPTE